MIVTTLKGGLGNQLFQYSTARNIALQRRVPLVLDLSWFHSGPGASAPTRRYGLDVFHGPNKTLKIYSGEKKGINRVLEARKWNKSRFHNIEEKGFSYNPLVKESQSNSWLDGYWQSERYFAEYRQQIQKDLSLANPLSHSSKKTAKEIIDAGEGAISIHVRRGDYVSNPSAASVHGVPSMDYYRAAVNQIPVPSPKQRFFVFSDEPNWCRENLQLNGPMTVIDHNAETPHEDLFLMSRCSHHITANSSFSWWGAWLGVNPKKTVVAPKKWFLDKSLDTSDLIPSSWVKI